MRKKDIEQLLRDLNITPKRAKGQNFLVDGNIIRKILTISNITDKDIILEIGPGLGALTGDLIKRAKKVITVEIEPKFCSYLSDKFSDFDNLEIINGDILDIDPPSHDKVIANIPYNITGPIMEKVFFQKNPAYGILTVEESIAKRIFYLQNYKLRSRISISVNSFMNPDKIFSISSQCFFPNPNIKLALISLFPKTNIDPFLRDEDSRNFYLKFIAGIMPYKNKSLANALELFLNKNLKGNYDRARILKILEDNKIENKKTFRLSIDEILETCIFFYYLNNNVNS